MTPADTLTVVAMASSLAVSVNDPPPQLTAETLLRAVAEGWCEGFVAELRHDIAGYALVSRCFEAHTGKRRLWLGDLYVEPCPNVAAARFFGEVGAQTVAELAITRLDRRGLGALASRV